jgi:hypothetical protein
MVVVPAVGGFVAWFVTTDWKRVP